MLNRANTVTNKPYVGYDGPRIADFSDDQLAGFDMVRNQAGQGSPLVDQAGQYVQNQLNGSNGFTASWNPYQGSTVDVGSNPYAGANPHLDQMIGNASRDVTENFSNVTQPNMLAQFNAGGAYGGSAMQNAMQSQQ